MYGSRRGFKITIDKTFVVEDADDQEALEDAIAAVVNELLESIDETTNEKMAKYQSIAGFM